MSKQRIEEYLPLAYDALRDCRIASGGTVDKALRGQISSFGAAVTMGSLLSAIAFFSQKSGAKSERQLLMTAVHYVILKGEKRPVTGVSETSLFDFVKKLSPADTDIWRERILDAAVAIKLAMNLYDQGRDTGSGSNGGQL